MSTQDLVKELDESEYILPKDILENNSEDELIDEIEAIFRDYKYKLDSESEFKRKYLELINFIYILNLQKENKRKVIFDKSLTDYLFSS